MSGRSGFTLAATAVVLGASGAGKLAGHSRPESHPVAPPVAVRLTLDQERYAPGSLGHVKVKTGEAGHLLVLHADPSGHIAIVFPLDPGQSDRVIADTEIEIKGRGDRDAFTIDDASGSGTWYAAISTGPFSYDSVTVNGHWDYRTIPRLDRPDAAEAVINGFVEALASTRFDYDIVSYSIDSTVVPTSTAPTTYSTPAPPQTSAVSASYGGDNSGGGDWWWRLYRPPSWLGPGWPGPYYDRSVAGPALASAPSAATDLAPPATRYAPPSASRASEPRTPAEHPAREKESGARKSEGSGGHSKR